LPMVALRPFPPLIKREAVAVDDSKSWSITMTLSGEASSMADANEVARLISVSFLATISYCWAISKSSMEVCRSRTPMEAVCG
jgi:hypothetical protein